MAGRTMCERYHVPKPGAITNAKSTHTWPTTPGTAHAVGDGGLACYRYRSSSTRQGAAVTRVVRSGLGGTASRLPALSTAIV
jgi:hypothetical protein